MVNENQVLEAVVAVRGEMSRMQILFLSQRTVALVFHSLWVVSVLYDRPVPWEEVEESGFLRPVPESL